MPGIMGPLVNCPSGDMDFVMLQVIRSGHHRVRPVIRSSMSFQGRRECHC
jgi:hypothetical protein